MGRAVLEGFQGLSHEGIIPGGVGVGVVGEAHKGIAGKVMRFGERRVRVFQFFRQRAVVLAGKLVSPW